MSSLRAFNLHIRPARPADAGFAAEMVQLSMGGLAEYLFQGDPHSILSILRDLFMRDAGRFSLKITSLAEYEGRLFGALVSCEGARLNRLNIATLPHLLRRIGLRRAAGLGWRAGRLPGGQEAGRDEYYISNLGVHPLAQRQGIGSRLLAFAEQTARGLRLTKCSLIVGLYNLDAFRLYERLGYQVVETVRDRDEALGYHRMVKVI
ncbi:MAG: GNAT family N-acetyltransferase [Chloroflexi bacterium]|nr:GNAT family N-acetyltransferase [Chloroflexota bacterium]